MSTITALRLTILTSLFSLLTPTTAQSPTLYLGTSSVTPFTNLGTLTPHTVNSFCWQTTLVTTSYSIYAGESRYGTQVWNQTTYSYGCQVGGGDCCPSGWDRKGYYATGVMPRGYSPIPSTSSFDLPSVVLGTRTAVIACPSISPSIFTTSYFVVRSDTSLGNGDYYYWVECLQGAYRTVTSGDTTISYYTVLEAKPMIYFGSAENTTQSNDNSSSDDPSGATTVTVVSGSTVTIGGGSTGVPGRDEEERTGLPTGVIAGIAVGVAVPVLLIIAGIVFILRRKRAQKAKLASTADWSTPNGGGGGGGGGDEPKDPVAPAVYEVSGAGKQFPPELQGGGISNKAFAELDNSQPYGYDSGKGYPITQPQELESPYSPTGAAAMLGSGISQVGKQAVPVRDSRLPKTENPSTTGTGQMGYNSGPIEMGYEHQASELPADPRTNWQETSELPEPPMQVPKQYDNAPKASGQVGSPSFAPEESGAKGYLPS